MKNECELKRRSQKGQKAEEIFLEMMLSQNKIVHPFQWGKESSASVLYSKIKKIPSPDFMVIDPYTNHTEFHEIKSKYPTYSGYFGLETYRLEALKTLVECGLSVWYTICLNASGSEKGKRFIDQIGYSEGDWITAPIKLLMNENDDTGFAPGLCRSEMKEKLPLLYWSYKRFKRLKIT